LREFCAESLRFLDGGCGFLRCRFVLEHPLDSNLVHLAVVVFDVGLPLECSFVQVRVTNFVIPTFASSYPCPWRHETKMGAKMCACCEFQRGRNTFGPAGLDTPLANRPLLSLGLTESATLRSVRRGHRIYNLRIGTQRIFVPFLPSNLDWAQISGRLGTLIWIHCRKRLPLGCGRALDSEGTRKDVCVRGLPGVSRKATRLYLLLDCALLLVACHL
jgi:hypothetical protein